MVEIVVDWSLQQPGAVWVFGRGLADGGRYIMDKARFYAPRYHIYAGTWYVPGTWCNSIPITTIACAAGVVTGNAGRDSSR